jgi:MSHA biogenesis protein MshQ
MPAGCSGSAGTYTCGAVTLASGDTIAIGAPRPATITFSSLTVGSAQINAAGAAADLTLNVTGMLTASQGATVKANVTAGNVSSTGAVSYGGNITATGSGYISLGAGTRVTGTLTTATGPITLLTGTASNFTTVGAINSGGTVTVNAYNGVAGETVGYLLSAAGYNTFGGAITATTTYVSLGGNATVGGSISAQTYVDTGSNSRVTGSITSATSYIDTGLNVRVTGSLTAGGTYVDIHSGANIGGSIKAQSYVSMTTGSTVGGNVTAQSTIAAGSGSTIGKCVRSNTSASILLPSPTAVGGACCGAGSTCGNACVSGSPKPPACTFPQSALVAEYRFEELAYDGSPGQVIDASGNGNHGRTIGATSSTPDGKICRGILVGKNLDSSIAAFDTGVDVNRMGNAGTVAFWYKSIASGKEHRMLFDATAGTNGRFYLYRDDDGTGVDLNFHMSDGGGTVRNVDKLNTIADEVWAHITITWVAATGSNATRLRLYVNGAQQDQQTYSVPSGVIASAISTLYFGDNRSAASPELNSANGYIDQVKLFDAELAAADVAALAAEAPTCNAAPHHIEVTSPSATGVTCSPNTFTVRACANASCSIPYTGAVSGRLLLSGTPNVVYNPTFSIPANSATASTTVSAHVTTPGTVTASLDSLSITPTEGATPYCGMGAAAAAGNSCQYTATTSGLLFNVPDHLADGVQTVTVSAVRSSDNAAVCTPAFANVDKAITFACGYTNPSSGTLPVRLGDATLGGMSALNSGNSNTAACGAGGRSVTMRFNASGVATARVAYADVGQVSLTASYTGSGADANLSMSGADSFIAAPAALVWSGLPTTTLLAGSTFSGTLTVLNINGAATPNFGRETPAAEGVTVSFAKARPNFTGASGGVFTGTLGSFSSGVAAATTATGGSQFAWSEVGAGDLNAVLTSGNYLGSGLTASGTTGTSGALGPFVPSHFDVSALNACGNFTYSGQPLGSAAKPLYVRARNASGGLTVNYDGSTGTSADLAKAIVLTSATGGLAGSWNGTDGAAASAFVRGVASLTSPTFTFSQKRTPPAVLVVRASEVSGGVSSAGRSEPSMPLRSGRLYLSNAFGSEKTSLQMPVQTQYWGTLGWVLNSDDSCTSVPAASVVRAGYLDAQGSPTTAWSSTPSAVPISGGRGNLTVSPPSPSGTGSVDIAINLGNTATDQSCLSTHPVSVGAGVPWLRSQQGITAQCPALSQDRDPSARATFGIFSPESGKVIHLRDVF